DTDRGGVIPRSRNARPRWNAICRQRDGEGTGDEGVGQNDVVEVWRQVDEGAIGGSQQQRIAGARCDPRIEETTEERAVQRQAVAEKADCGHRITPPRRIQCCVWDWEERKN